MEEAGAAGFTLRRASVVFRPGRPALSGIHLDVAPGEQLGLVGPSGAGKTTLLRLLNGSLAPSEGEVRVDGRPLAGLPPRSLRAVQASIATIHQSFDLIPNLRVVRNVLLGRVGRASLLGSLRAVLFPGRGSLLEVHGLLERVGIGEKLFERTDHLSGGQQQRVAIARSLYQRPAAVLADEPFASVDPARARDTFRLLLKLSRELGFTLVVSLHDLPLARRFLPRLVGLRDGRVVFDRPTADLSESDFEALYDLGDDPRLEDAC